MQLRKLYCTLLFALLINSSFGGSKYVQVINTNKLNTYRLEVLNKDNESKQIIIGTTYDQQVYAVNLKGKLIGILIS